MRGMNFAFLNNLKNWQIFLILAAVVFSLYGQAIFFGFSYLDDNNLLIDRYYSISNPSNVSEAFKQDVFNSQLGSAYFYRPFLTISFMIDVFLGAKNAGSFHFSNILLHLMAVFLLFIFLQKLNYGRLLSFLASLFFAVHPALSQAVSWIPGRNDSLLTIFILASFIFLIDYFKNHKVKNLSWHLIFFLAALFSKETTLFAPVVFAAYIVVHRKEIFSNTQNEVSRFLYLFIGWISSLIFWFFLRGQALGGGIANMPLAQSIKSVFNNLPAMFLYIGKIFFPFNLSVLPILQDSVFIYGIIAVLLLAIIIFFNRKSLNIAGVIFGFFWFLFFLLPSSLQPNRQIAQLFLEHRLYLPIIGFIIIFLEIYFSAREYQSSKSRYLRMIFFVLIIIFFSVINLFHSRVFMNRITFWENAVYNSPRSPLAHRNLGAMYWLDGRANEAEKEYKESLKLNPDELMAHNNLGLIYAGKGDFENAVKEYETELKINPYYDNALYNSGLAYWALGKKEEAAQKWQETLTVNPDYLDAYKSLIVFYQEIGKKDLAEKLLFELKRLGGL